MTTEKQIDDFFIKLYKSDGFCVGFLWLYFLFSMLILAAHIICFHIT